MSGFGLLRLRNFDAVAVALLVWIFIGCSCAVASVVQQNATNTATVDCSKYGSSCFNCSRVLRCAWCFSQKACLPEDMRNHRDTCKEDDWYYGDCNKPQKEKVLVYVLLSCALFLLMIVILLVLYIFFCKMPRNKDYELVSTREKKKRKRTPLMSKKAKPSGSRTEELKKKYQLDG